MVLLWIPKESCLFFDLVSVLVKVHPFAGLFVNELGPFGVLRDEALVICGIVQDPLFLADNVGDLVSLCRQDFLDFLTGVEVQVISFHNQWWFCKLMQRWRGRQGPLQRIRNQGNDNIFAGRQIGAGKCTGS